MTRFIGIFGKEGSGKTTLAANLAISLRKLKRKVALIDLNTQSPNMYLHFDAHPGGSLHSMLAGKTDHYMHHSGVAMVLSGLDEEHDVKEIGTEKLHHAFRNYEFVIIDSPGYGSDARHVMDLCTEIITVANPSLSSATEAARFVHAAMTSEKRPRVTGVVVNKARKKKSELNEKEIARFIEAPVLQVIPYDDSAVECENSKKLLSTFRPKAKSSKAIDRLAERLCMYGFR